jgi:hypothetical protein
MVGVRQPASLVGRIVMAKVTKPPIERSTGPHHLFGDSIHHYTRKSGITSLEIMPFASSETVPPDDVEFTALLESDLSSVIYSCIWMLSQFGFFKKAACRSGYHDDGTPFVKPRDWLHFEASAMDGSALFETIRDTECDDEGCVIDPFWESTSKKVPLIAVAAKLIWADQCVRGEIFSEPWYCAKILELWYWPSYSIVDRAVLIGQLYAELGIKYAHEEDTVRGQKFRGGPKQARNANEQSKRDRKTRFRLVEDQLQLLSEAELASFCVKSSGRIKAKPLARLIESRIRFEAAKVRPVKLEAIAEILKEILQKSQKPSR